MREPLREPIPESLSVGGGGGGAWTTTTTTSAYTASDRELVFANASGGGFTVTLPAAGDEARVIVKKTDDTANAVTLATPGSASVEGESSLALTGGTVSREVASDGDNYWVI